MALVVEFFFLEEEDGIRDDLVTLLREDYRRDLVTVVDDAADLLVDDRSHLLRVVPLLAKVAPEEHELLAMTHSHRAELVRHSPLGHHPARHLGGLLDAVLCARRDVAEDDLLRHP